MAPTLAVERLVVWGYAVSGFAALGYEVLWTRVVSIALGITTTQSLSVMLGGAIGAPLADRLRAGIFAFGLAEWALGLFGLASIALLTAVTRIVDALGAPPGWGGHVARLLQVNGAGEVPTDPNSIRVFRLLGTLPLALHPSPDDVLVVAYGGGITLSAVAAQHPSRIDCAEIVPAVVDASPLFERWNGGLAARLDEAGVRLVFDDGRNHVLRTTRRYDVIISDSTHPATADSWVLYTREFYRLCRERLNDGGMMA